MVRRRYWNYELTVRSSSLRIRAEFLPQPYGLSAADVGYLSVGPYFGGFVASVLMFINDPMLNGRLARTKEPTSPNSDSCRGLQVC